MRPSSEPVDEAVALHDQALQCRADGDYKRAEQLARQSLELLEAEAGPDHPDVANVLDCLAGVRAARLAYGEAVELYRRALGILERASDGGGVVARLWVQTSAHLADTLRDLGRYDEAESLLGPALALAAGGAARRSGEARRSRGALSRGPRRLPARLRPGAL